jgi:hypothetical protein
MTIRPPDAWTLRRLLCGYSMNGQLTSLADPWKRMAEHLDGLPKEGRQAAWMAMLAARPEAAELVKALEEIDPNGPAPTTVAAALFATLADVAKIISAQSWLWKGWLAQLSQERIRREIRHFAQPMQCNMFALKLGPLDKNDNRIRAVGDEISKIVTNSDDVHLALHWMFRHL